jgi:carboxyl-terminal processing protease
MGTKERLMWILITIFLITLIFISLIISDTGISMPFVRAKSGEYNDMMKVFKEAYSKVMDRYVDVDKLDTEELFYGSIDGMVASLDDPHSQFYTPDEFKEMNEDIEGKFAGIGAYIINRNDQVQIASPIEGTPAFEAGIKANDIIIEINGESADGISTFEASNRIKGEPGTEVTLTIKRPGKKDTITFTITRAIIEIPTVKHKMITDDIGYIELISFSHTAPKSIKDAISKMKKEGMKKLIIDIRSNPGGTLSAGKEIADLFLDKGKIVYTVGRNDEILQTFKAKEEETDELDIPLIILQNEYSASASEILTGALKDTQRALIIGKTSYGKGSVQSFMPLKEKLMDRTLGIKITIAHWYTPSGKQIDGQGIEPHITIEENEDEYVERVFYENKLYEGNYLQEFIQNHKDFTRDDVKKFKKELENEHIYIETDRLGSLLMEEKNRYETGLILDTEYDKILKKAISTFQNGEYEQKEILSFD